MVLQSVFHLKENDKKERVKIHCGVTDCENYNYFTYKCCGQIKENGCEPYLNLKSILILIQILLLNCKNVPELLSSLHRFFLHRSLSLFRKELKQVWRASISKPAFLGKPHNLSKDYLFFWSVTVDGESVTINDSNSAGVKKIPR